MFHRRSGILGDVGQTCKDDGPMYGNDLIQFDLQAMSFLEVGRSQNTEGTRENGSVFFFLRYYKITNNFQDVPCRIAIIRENS